MRGRNIACLGIAVGLLVAGCASGDDDDDVATDTTEAADDTSDTTSATDSEATGPAPGVTDDTIKIGFTYVDTEALKAVNLDYNLGDWAGAAQALIDDINADGGINGRMLEAVIAPIDPTGPTSAEEACLKLTEDDDVFLVTGFFLNDAVLCPLDTHQTALIGGGITPDRLAAAKAPWISPLPDTDLPITALEAMAEAGDLDGKVAVVAHAQDQPTYDLVLPKLEELGIDPVETALIDAPTDDTAALQSNVNLIAEKFEAAGADTVLVVGIAGANWPLYMVDNPYRPSLRFTEITAARAFTTNASVTDTSIMEGGVFGGVYGPDQAIYDEAAMQDCIAILEAAGIDSPPPSEVGTDPSNQPYQAAFNVCPNIILMRALLEAAGENLNYGTLEAAIDGLKVTIPGDPSERTYGPSPDLDGNPTAYLFSWNEAEKNFEVIED